VCLVSLQN